MLKSLLATAATAAMLIGATATAQAHTKELWMLGGFSHPESVELDIPFPKCRAMANCLS